LSKVRTVTIEVAVQVELDKINHSSNEKNIFSLRWHQRISRFFFFLFPASLWWRGFLQNLRIIRAGKTFFWGSYLEDNGVNHPKKVFPARIMSFCGNPRNHIMREQGKRKSSSAFSPITRYLGDTCFLAFP
jgi:hypothetical protein